MIKEVSLRFLRSFTEDENISKKLARELSIKFAMGPGINADTFASEIEMQKRSSRLRLPLLRIVRDV